MRVMPYTIGARWGRLEAMHAAPTIPAILAALKAGTIHRDDAIEEIAPHLDRLFAFDLIPVVGGVIEEVSDLLLIPMATALVDGALRKWGRA